MAEFYNAETLLEFVKQNTPHIDGETTMKCVERAIKEAPTADVVSTKVFEQVKWERDTAIEQLESYGVGFCENKELVEVKHGEWIDDKHNRARKICSICFNSRPRENDHEFRSAANYCPNCGAKMDGEGNKHSSMPDDYSFEVGV